MADAPTSTGLTVPERVAHLEASLERLHEWIAAKSTWNDATTVSVVATIDTVMELEQRVARLETEVDRLRGIDSGIDPPAGG